MRFNIVIAIFALFLAGCKSGVGPPERLGWYVPYIPANLNILQFYETPSPSMDHEYMWQMLTHMIRKIEKPGGGGMAAIG